MSVHVLSHLEFLQEAARLDSLVLGMAGEELESPDHVSEWDYETSLAIRADVTVDLADGLASAGLSTESQVGLSIVWHSTGSGLRGASEVQPVRDGLNSIELQFAGPELGGILVLHVVVVLLEAGPGCEALAARRPGSRLWNVERRIRLEGDGSRFPISHVSFASTGLAGGLPAAWAVVFESTDLFDSGLGNVRLYLNTDHAKVERFIVDPAQEPILEQVLRSDVNRQLVLQALNHEELSLEIEYPSESMGELLAMSVKRNFPDRTLDEVRSMSQLKPGEFEGYLQARGGFLL